MSEYLPWVILVALLGWVGAPLLRDALVRRRRAREARPDHLEDPFRATEPAEAEAAAQAQAQAQAEADAQAQAEAERQRELDQVAEATRRLVAQRKAELEAARLEAERLQALAAEAERARQEAARREAERLEAERVEAARLRALAEQARQAAEAERARQEAARREAERLEAERVEAARLQALAAEQARQAAEAERARQEAAQREAERLEAERAEAERLRTLAAEQARQAQIQAEDKARRDEAERQAAELACEQARLAAEEAARLQAQVEALATPAAQAPAAKPRTPAQTLVLVADDSKVVRVKTSRLLIKHGYQVALAEDGTDAVKQLTQSPPHVLITDVEMPGMDGFELSRHVRELPHMAHIPIIMVTAAEDKHAPQAAKSGVSVLLGKPYRDEELIAYVESALTENSAEAAVR